MTRGIDSYPGQFGNPPGVRFSGDWYKMIRRGRCWWRAAAYAVYGAQDNGRNREASQDVGDWYLASRTEDDRQWVIGTLSDTRPLIEYLFDREAKSLRELHHVYPELAAAPLVPMRAVTIKSRDGLDLASYVIPAA